MSDKSESEVVWENIKHGRIYLANEPKPTPVFSSPHVNPSPGREFHTRNKYEHANPLPSTPWRDPNPPDALPSSSRAFEINLRVAQEPKYEPRDFNISEAVITRVSGECKKGKRPLKKNIHARKVIMGY